MHTSKRTESLTTTTDSPANRRNVLCLQRGEYTAKMLSKVTLAQEHVGQRAGRCQKGGRNNTDEAERATSNQHAMKGKERKGKAKQALERRTRQCATIVRRGKKSPVEQIAPERVTRRR